jgi:hypothetical protein
MPNKDPEKRKEVNRIWRLAHKEQLQISKKIYSDAHKKEKAEYDKIYREENQEKILEYREENRDKLLEQKKEYNKRSYESGTVPSYNYDYVRNKGLFKKYGITLEEYQKLWDDQNGVCAICGNPEPKEGYMLAVDHDHITGKIRGLLCSRCNTSIGKFEDSIEILQNAIKYLIRNKV